jgi:hypothetical protein
VDDGSRFLKTIRVSVETSTDVVMPTRSNCSPAPQGSWRRRHKSGTASIAAEPHGSTKSRKRKLSTVVSELIARVPRGRRIQAENAAGVPFARVPAKEPLSQRAPELCQKIRLRSRVMCSRDRSQCLVRKPQCPRQRAKPAWRASPLRPLPLDRPSNSELAALQG